ncbi:cyclic nucleotide-binding domain protein (macronuclear) [Tetrahymena thermophila SB210]|uniref:Cyclic nucleotide-binding domain protein n=1 Tax=Tetrahymena thermophila (strain SB210) TaxID=312017 RepID=Q22AQ2_TETTS|nr:cyclic nucleotide-binding domain protein [Tetrahymena thermophila SB210]EAR82383.2 cyclic nucleotide-binding domain protein [Tetrahymena thermophila SB210]|eukprot:XP_001030046.2 cyclic nucleotide-binding domain protein [Tetrahymena thermophila SB210]
MSVQQDRLNQIIEILKTPSSLRAEVQISFLQQETNHIGLFKQYKEEDGDDELQRLCCMYMKYEYQSKDQTLFNIDDFGTKFYIILSGKVGVYIRMPKQKRLELFQEQNNQNKAHEPDPLQMVKELRMGDSFGELALLKNSKRLATIICKEDCHFGVIDKKIFNLALKEKEEEKLNIQMRFLANSPLFSRLPKNTIKHLHMNAFYVQYQKGQPVYLEGQNSNSCFVIKSGEFTIYKTIQHVMKTHEKKNQYLTGGEQKNLDIKISVLGKGELFGEIELIQGDSRCTSAFCSSLDGGELMIINRTDLENKVLCEEEYMQQFQNYIKMKKEQLKKRIEGIKNQLHKYQTYRFMTSALKIHEVDVCEKIKNKELNYSIDVLDDVIQSQTDKNDDDEVGILSAQKSSKLKQLQQVQKYKPKSKSSINILSNTNLKFQNNQSQTSLLNLASINDLANHEENSQLKSQNSQQQITQPSSQEKLNINSSQQINNFAPVEDKKINEVTAHITKNSKEQFMNKWFKYGEGEEGPQQSENKSKKQKLLRVELNSYTELKNSIRKKTAIALSKQYRLPYEKFMYAGSMYDISQSEDWMKQQQMQPQQQPDTINRKTISSLSKLRVQTQATLNHIQTCRHMSQTDNFQVENQSSIHKIKSLACLDAKQNLNNIKQQQKPVIKEDFQHLKSIQQFSLPDEQAKNNFFNSIQRIQSSVSLKSQDSKNWISKQQKENDNFKSELLDKLQQFKQHQQHQQSQNDIPNLKKQSSKSPKKDTDLIEDVNLMKSIEDHYNNSLTEEGSKKYQKKLKNILKLDIQHESSDNSRTSTSNLNTPKLIQSKKASQASLFNMSSSTNLKSQQNLDNKSQFSSIPLKNAEILFEKQGKKLQKKQHLRLHENKDSPLKFQFSQSTRHSMATNYFQPKNFVEDQNQLPYWVQPLSTQNSDQQQYSKNQIIDFNNQNNQSLSQTLSPQNQKQKQYKMQLSSYFKPKNIKSEFGEDLEKETSLIDKQLSKEQNQLTLSQNKQKSFIYKNNSSAHEMNQIISIKSVNNLSDLNNRAISSERQFRQKQQTNGSSSQNIFYKTFHQNKKILKNIAPYNNKKQTLEQPAIYKFQQDSPLKVKKYQQLLQPQQQQYNLLNQILSTPKITNNS